MISPENNFTLLAIILVIVILAVWLERFNWARSISAALIALFLGTLFSNTGVIPFAAPSYGWIVNYLIPVAIPLLLFKTNLKLLFSETRHIFPLFCIAALGTIIGGAVGFMILPLESEAEKLMGIFIASYIGGSVNFVTVSQVLDLNDPNLLSSAVAADNIVGTFYLVILTLIATNNWLQHRFLTANKIRDISSQERSDLSIEKSTRINYMGTALLLILSFLIFSVCKFISGWLNLTQYNLLFVTVASVIVANIFSDKLKNIRGDFELGLVFMYVFFVVIGAGSNIRLLIDYGPILFFYAATICFTHLVFVFTCAKLMGYSLPEAVTMSNACVLGPATAVALAAQRKWTHLITPGLLCGLFGYVIANIIGVSIALWIQ